jgi:hypothetical protein
MKAIIKTESNYNNCNHKILDVVSINDKFITLLIPKNGFDIDDNPIGDETIEADFNISEELVYLSE